MTAEYCFALVDFVCRSGSGPLRIYEAGRSYPMSPAVAHAAAKRGLVAKGRPSCWIRPSVLRQPEVLSVHELDAADAELLALENYAREGAGPVA
jgi:hypothetical protein